MTATDEGGGGGGGAEEGGETGWSVCGGHHEGKIPGMCQGITWTRTDS